MKFSHKLSDGVHILAYVDIYKDGDLSSQTIASSIESNPSLVRRMMSRLVKAGLLQTSPGKVDPNLARSADTITLLDIYCAVEDDKNILHIDDKTNLQCVVGANIQDTLRSVYDDIQMKTELAMKEVTLQELIDDILIREKSRSVGQTKM